MLPRPVQEVLVEVTLEGCDWEGADLMVNPDDPLMTPQQCCLLLNPPVVSEGVLKANETTSI